MPARRSIARMPDRKPPIRLAAVGDSILADGGLWARFALEGRAGRYAMPPGFDRAVGGATTQDVLDGLEAVIALAPDVLVLHAGTNDLLIGNEPARAIFARLARVCARCLQSGIGHLVVVGVLPRRDVFWQDCPFRHRDRRRLNALLRALPRDPAFTAYRGRIGIVDLEGSFDPLVNTHDGLHPSLTGAQKLGRAIGRELDRIDGTVPAGPLRAIGDALGRAARGRLARLRGRNPF